MTESKKPRQKHLKLASEIATDIFHKWADLPDYEPLDEDMVINLVGKIRDEIARHLFEKDQLEADAEELVQALKEVERKGGYDETGSAIISAMALSKWREKYGGK